VHAIARDRQYAESLHKVPAGSKKFTGKSFLVETWEAASLVMRSLRTKGKKKTSWQGARKEDSDATDLIAALPR
jgi:hypothetical protein